MLSGRFGLITVLLNHSANTCKASQTSDAPRVVVAVPVVGHWSSCLAKTRGIYDSFCREVKSRDPQAGTGVKVDTWLSRG